MSGGANQRPPLADLPPSNYQFIYSLFYLLSHLFIYLFI